MSAWPDSPWLIDFPHDGATDAELRLFGFHYAGAGASIFESWAAALAPRVAVHAIQLPGREERFGEPFESDIHKISAAVATDLPARLDRPFVFFGHSIGALIAFDLARVLRRDGPARPELLIVSGQNAPQKLRPDRGVHKLPDDEFVQVLRGYGGTPEAILDNDDLLELLLPRLRADIAVSETYDYRPEPPLDCRVAAFYGTDDSLVREPRVLAWEAQSADGFEAYRFPGNHFFLHTAEPAVLASLRLELDRVAPGAGS